jgi:hypothetical protein
MELALSTGTFEVDGTGTPNSFIFSFSNPGPRAALLHAYGLAFKKPDTGAQSYLPAQDAALPRQLAPGSRSKTGMDPKVVGKALVGLGLKGKVEVEGFHQDAGGMHYTGVPVLFDLDKWGR